MPTRITVIASGAHHELLVSYDGRQPPLDLFSTWTSLGWHPPTPALPPRSAIDWSTPDPETGRAYSLHSWDAQGVATLAQHSRDDVNRLAGAVAAARGLGYEVVEVSTAATPAAPDPSDPRPSPVDSPDPRSETHTHITAVLLAHAAPSLVAGARSRGATVVTRETSISRTVRYRGSTNVTQTPAIEVEIDIADGEVDAVVSALTPHATSPPQVVRVG